MSGVRGVSPFIGTILGTAHTLAEKRPAPVNEQVRVRCVIEMPSATWERGVSCAAL